MSVFTGEFTSDALRRNVVTRVIFPDSPYDLPQLNQVPKTMYLLHGYSGSSGDWLRFTRIEYFARLYNFTVVMADAGNSFYSNMAYGGDYLRFFGEELPKEMNRRFRLPETTFICGQSMGGHGCVKVGLTYPQNYQAIGCLSGGVDMRGNLALNKAMRKDMLAIFGDPIRVPPEDDCFCLAEKAVKEGTALPMILYCGTEDFLYEGNCRFHEHLTKIGYPHEYHTGPGAHLWSYWESVMPELMEKLCALSR